MIDKGDKFEHSHIFVLVEKELHFNMILSFIKNSFQYPGKSLGIENEKSNQLAKFIKKLKFKFGMK